MLAKKHRPIVGGIFLLRSVIFFIVNIFPYD